MVSKELTAYKSGMKSRERKRKHGHKRASVAEIIGVGLTGYQAGKVGYGNYPWLANVKENPTQFALNFIGMGSGSFSLSDLIEVDGPAAVGYIAEKVLHKMGLDFKLSRRFKA